MKRAPLVWFAVGAAVSGVSAAAATILIRETRPKTFLLIDQDYSYLDTAETHEQLALGSTKILELARSCGLDVSFEFGGVDGPSFGIAEVQEQNVKQINCMIAAAHSRGFEVKIANIAESDKAYAQTH